MTIYCKIKQTVPNFAVLTLTVEFSFFKLDDNATSMCICYNAASACIDLKPEL